MVYTRLIVTLPGIYDKTMNERCRKDEKRKGVVRVKVVQEFPLETVLNGAPVSIRPTSQGQQNQWVSTSMRRLSWRQYSIS
ncbi:hypothetical protein EDC47_1186 [Raoultella planticola]|nr:hypothetical protein EDC47_1186 [Raoultella planticola]